MNNIDLNKVMQNTKFHESYLIEQLQDAEYQKEFLSATIEDFLEDGDYDSFFH